MERLILNVGKLSKGLAMVSKVVLTFSILLTVVDVIGRSFRRPVLGTYELVCLSSAIVFGFCLPHVSWMKSHIAVDFLIEKLPPVGRRIFRVAAKCAGIGLFLIIGKSLLALAGNLHKAGEVSVLLYIPFYPIVYAMGICCFIVVVVLMCDIVKIVGGKHE
jgi:TRAP-type C4-dicarboxylate transport system permease small subunit